jgi:hypothetical protein
VVADAMTEPTEGDLVFRRPVEADHATIIELVD